MISMYNGRTGRMTSHCRCTGQEGPEMESESSSTGPKAGSAQYTYRQTVCKIPYAEPVIGSRECGSSAMTFDPWLSITLSAHFKWNFMCGDCTTCIPSLSRDRTKTLPAWHCQHRCTASYITHRRSGERRRQQKGLSNCVKLFIESLQERTPRKHGN